nr:hypothetical protein [Tanacetum cinerariifolium]
MVVSATKGTIRFDLSLRIKLLQPMLHGIVKIVLSMAPLWNQPSFFGLAHHHVKSIMGHSFHYHHNCPSDDYDHPNKKMKMKKIKVTPKKKVDEYTAPYLGDLDLLLLRLHLLVREGGVYSFTFFLGVTLIFFIFIFLLGRSESSEAPFA